MGRRGSPVRAGGAGTGPGLTPLLSPARTVFLRLASLLVLLSSLWNQITCGGDAEDEKCKACGYNYKELPVRRTRGWDPRFGRTRGRGARTPSPEDWGTGAPLKLKAPEEVSHTLVT